MFPSRNVFFLLLALVYFSAYTQEEKITLLNIHLSGNTVTKPFVFYQEITLKAGGIYTKEEFERELVTSRNNLLNSSLFNFVKITPLQLNQSKYDIIIEVQERWYIWPIPVISTADPNANLWWETQDFSRLNYGVLLTHNNLRGARENLSLLVQFGYSKQFELAYKIPYLIPQKNIGVGIAAGYLQNYEIVTATENNERIFFFSKEGNSRQIKYANAYFEKRITPQHTHKFGFGAAQVSISDSALTASENYLGNNLKSVQFASLSYTFRYDKRDNVHYPLQGFFTKIHLEQNGLGVFSNDELNVQNISAELKYFHPFNDKFYWAGMLKAKQTSYSNLPYFFQRGLGYEDFVRGYEYYILDGQAYGLGKTNFKYRLIAAKQRNLPLIENRKFKRYFYAVYINTFADAGFVKNRLTQNENNLTNQFLFGSGIGLDFVTYYDKVFRFEFAVNRKREPGIYLHFTQPI
jgi:outer membrane protein assembly factor BamA